MFGQNAFKEEDATLREIVRSIDKKMDYTAREGEGATVILQLTLRGHETTMSVSLENLQAAKTDLVKRQQLRQKIKARRDHIDNSRFAKDVLGLKAARLLRSAPKPEISLPRRGFGRGGPRR